MTGCEKVEEKRLLNNNSTSTSLWVRKAHHLKANKLFFVYQSLSASLPFEFVPQMAVNSDHFFCCCWVAAAAAAVMLLLFSYHSAHFSHDWLIYIFLLLLLLDFIKHDSFNEMCCMQKKSIINNKKLKHLFSLAWFQKIIKLNVQLLVFNITSN